jgi:hypothetical protein
MAKNSKHYTNLYVKRRLVKLEIDVFGIISNGLLHHTPKHKVINMIQKEVRLLSVQLGLDDQERNSLWNNSYSKYLTVSRRTTSSLRKIELKFGRKEDYEESLVQRRAVIYSSIRANIMSNALIKEANQIMYSYEQRLKHEDLFGPDGLLANADDSKSPFFLCSSHPNPAKDHAAYQGKLYYDEDWEKYVPAAEADHVRAIIRNRRLDTIQWVVGEPVYLTTRRNCKHYFINIPIEEVLHASARSLLKKHGMRSSEPEAVSREVLYYREYYNRLKVEEALHKLVPNEKLAQDIARDKKLLDKWKNKL